MLKPPDFWFFLIASFFFFLICLDLAAPSIAGAYSSYPYISKVKDFHQLIVICFLLLSCQNKILSFGTHIILYLLPHMLNRWCEDWLEVKEEWENDWMSLICSLLHKFKGRLDWIFIYYSIENCQLRFFFLLEYQLRLEDTVIFLTSFL